MAISKIKGPLLADNLERRGVNLVIDNDLVFFNVENRRVGINNTEPGAELDVSGTISTNHLQSETLESGTGFVQTLAAETFDTTIAKLGDVKVQNSSISSESQTGDLGIYPSGNGKIVTNSVISGVVS